MLPVIWRFAFTHTRSSGRSRAERSVEPLTSAVPDAPWTTVVTIRPETPRTVSEKPVTGPMPRPSLRSEEHTSELQSRVDLVCRLLLEKTNYGLYQYPVY